MEYDRTAKLLRHQRHDFNNYLQVIKGYLDLDMPEKAARYLDEVDRQMKEASRVFHLLSEEAAVLFCELQLDAYEKGLTIKLDKVTTDRAEPLVPAGLMLLWQELQEKVDGRQGELEVWLSVLAAQDKVTMNLRWPGVSGPEVRDIVLTR